ncbi:ferritin-like domain-containing protein [Hyphococcus sp.]|uniref:ferritin-like domain-containing protein n=1 Tax=Hyphococcus sp. TaxID=2038636 RepID=UPI003CCBA8B1
MILPPAPTLLSAASAALRASSPDDKIAKAAAAERLLRLKTPLGENAVSPPQRPGRPSQPVLSPPADVPKRRLGSPEGRAALLHAIAHIEFNAINLAFDMAVRFSRQIGDFTLDIEAFGSDWVRIGAEEARHFSMIQQRLKELGSYYGALPAHNGLWEAAEDTRHDVLARLAIAPLVLEARGLDVTPQMIEKLDAAGDRRSSAILQTIYDEEIGHVACGKHWFDSICARIGRDPKEAFHDLRGKYFKGQIKPPFNHNARSQAGMNRAFYEL